MSLRLQLLTSHGILVLVILLLSVYAAWGLNQSTWYRDRIQFSFEQVTALQNIALSITRQQKELIDILVFEGVTHDGELREYYEYQKKTDEYLRQFVDVTAREYMHVTEEEREEEYEERNLAEAIAPLIERIIELSDEIVLDFSIGRPISFERMSKITEEDFDDILFPKLLDQIDDELSEVKRTNIDSAEFTQVAAVTLLIVCVMAILSLVVTIIIVLKGIIRPLDGLSDVVSGIMSPGDIPELPATGFLELRRIYSAFSHLADRLRAVTVSRDFFDVVVEKVQHGLIITDERYSIASANQAACSVLGRSKAQLIAADLRTMVRVDDHLGSAWDDAFAVDQAAIDRQSGMVSQVILSGNAVIDADGAKKRVFSIVDVSALRQVQDRLRGALVEKTVLLREVHHRVKNNLQVIIAMMRLQAHGIEDPAVAQHLEEANRRILSIALVHELLCLSEDLGRINLKSLLQRLLVEVERNCAAHRPPLTLEVAADDVVMDMDRAVPLGQIISELVSNATKHGFPDGAGGTITVRLSEQEDQGGRGRRVILTVSDTGVGLPAGFDLRSDGALGLRLVTSLADQLGADLCVATTNGVSFTLTVQG